MPLDPQFTLTAHADGAHARRRRVRTVAGAVVLAVVVAGAGVAFAGSNSGARYRTTTVSSHSMEQVLNGVGTIEPVSQATVAFPVAGTVASVAVKPGDTVTAGTELAALDQASLQEAVRQAQSNLDQANLTLERARNGESVTSSGGLSGANAQPAAFNDDSWGTSDAVLLSATSDDQALAAAQQAVLDAQKQVDQDLAAADQAYATAQQVCAALTSTKSSATSSSDSTSSSSDSGTNDLTACSNALDAVLQAQHQVSTSQQALAAASSALDALLAQRAATPPTSGGATTDPNAASGSQANGSQANGSSARTGTSPSAADLAAYQKAVDAADANLAVARQALLQASMVSPIDGTVVAVNMAPGDTVTASSTTATIVIAGDGGYEAVTMVKVADLPRLKVGQAASVQPDGSDTTITGKVTSIGLVSTSSTSDTTYPVTVSLDGDTSQLHNGGTASIAITTASATSGLAVPSSAVHTNNGTHTVVVPDGDAAKDVIVQVGAIGPEWTEIKSGLDAGQTIVVADLHAPLPTSATSSSNGQQQNPFGGRGGFRTTN